MGLGRLWVFRNFRPTATAKNPAASTHARPTLPADASRNRQLQLGLTDQNLNATGPFSPIYVLSRLCEGLQVILLFDTGRNKFCRTLICCVSCEVRFGVLLHRDVYLNKVTPSCRGNFRLLHVCLA